MAYDINRIYHGLLSKVIDNHDFIYNIKTMRKLLIKDKYSKRFWWPLNDLYYLRNRCRQQQEDDCS